MKTETNNERAIPFVAFERSSPLRWERPLFDEKGVARKPRLRLRLEGCKAREYHGGLLRISRRSESEAVSPALLQEIIDRRQHYKALFEAGMRN